MKPKPSIEVHTDSRACSWSGSALPIFALLLVASSYLSIACSSGSSSPTEPVADPITLDVSTSDDSAVGASSGAEVDGAVTGVDAAAQTIFLATGDRVVVEQKTIWDPLGDLFSFNQLMNAFNAGQNVRVEADGSFSQTGSVLASTIKAEIDEGSNDSGPSDDGSNDDSDADTDLDDDVDSDDGDDSDDSDSADSDGADSDDQNSGNSGQG
jgi:hypothetical protein